VVASGDLARPVVGPAGTGKTEAMRAVVRALAGAGHTVLGTANGGRQAEELHERLDVPTRVVSGWLTLLDHTEDPTDVWPPGTALLCVFELAHGCVVRGEAGSGVREPRSAGPGGAGVVRVSWRWS
jgi:hypothetical protein